MFATSDNPQGSTPLPPATDFDFITTAPGSRTVQTTGVTRELDGARQVAMYPDLTVRATVPGSTEGATFTATSGTTVVNGSCNATTDVCTVGPIDSGNDRLTNNPNGTARQWLIRFSELGVGATTTPVTVTAGPANHQSGSVDITDELVLSDRSVGVSLRLTGLTDTSKSPSLPDFTWTRDTTGGTTPTPLPTGTLVGTITESTWASGSFTITHDDILARPLTWRSIGSPSGSPLVLTGNPTLLGAVPIRVTDGGTTVTPTSLTVECGSATCQINGGRLTGFTLLADTTYTVNATVAGTPEKRGSAGFTPNAAYGNVPSEIVVPVAAP